MKKICTIYRSAKHEGMYLYVEKKEDLSRVPEALLKRFGRPERAMTLLIEPTRKLARVDTQSVLAALDEEGFYLQLPPKPEDGVMREIRNRNTKM